MIKPIRYVIFNGPPRAGKTTLSRELARCLRDGSQEVVTDSFAAPIKHFVAAAMAAKYDVLDKEAPRPELNGYSVRQALIMLAEDHIKPVYGDDVFGKWLVHRSLKLPDRRPDFVIVDDGGFPPEIEAVPNRFVVKVVRKGTDFTGDSRGYVSVVDWVFMNDGSPAEMWRDVKELWHGIRRWAAK